MMKHAQRRTFLLMWITYASFYFGRVNYGVAQPGLLAEGGLSKVQAGAIASAMLAAYALGQIVNGSLGERLGARRMIFAGLLGSALANLIFSLGSGWAVLAALWACNGFCQSAGWPSAIRTMGRWFPARKRGTVMGFWGTSYQVGNAASWLLAGAVFTRWGWRWTFRWPALLMVLAALWFQARIQETPEDTGLPIPSGVSSETHTESALVALRRVLANRDVRFLALAYAGLGFVRYGFLNWGITYVVEKAHASVGKATLSMLLLPLAGAVGAAAVGWFSDRFGGGRRAPVAVILFAGLAAGIWVFGLIPVGAGERLAACAGGIGFCLYGLDVLLGGPAAQDLAPGGRVAATAGFVNGMMYLGAIFSGFGTGWMIDRFGWEHAVHAWLAVALVSGVITARLWNKS